MIAKQMISDSIPSIKTSDTVGRAMDWMSEFKTGQLPVVNNAELLGFVTEEDLLDAEDSEAAIGSLRLSLPENTYVYEDSHIYEVIKAMSSFHLDVIPVLNSRSHHYQGLITTSDAVKYISDMIGAQEPGGIIVLEIPQNSYSLSEIARLCESNDAKIISLSLLPSPDHSRLLVNIKLNIRELSRVIATFERFEYTIASVVFDTEQLHDYRENYENLIRYLNS